MEYKKNDSVKSNAGGKWKSVFEGKIDSVTFNKHKGIFSYNVIFPAQHGEEEFECDLKAKYIFTDNNGKCKKRNGETIKSSSSSSSRKKRKPCKKISVNINNGNARQDIREDMMEAALINITRRSELVAQRFLNENIEELKGTKCTLWRECDRHSIYYVRSIVNLLCDLRKIKHDDGYNRSFKKLSDKEAEAVVLASIAFRYTNRMDLWVYYSIMRKRKESMYKLLSKEEQEDMNRAKRDQVEHEVKPTLTHALRFEEIDYFLKFIETLYKKKQKGEKCISIFTGRHQSGHYELLRKMLLSLQDKKSKLYLKNLTRNLRNAPGAKEARDLIQEFNGIGDFFGFQIYQDLVNPKHSIYLGCGMQGAHDKDRFTAAGFGPGSLKGAKHMAGLSKIPDQDKARDICEAIVNLANKPLSDTDQMTWFEKKYPKLWSRFHLNRQIVVPLPHDHKGAGGLALDMQTIEGFLCSIHELKTPKAVIGKVYDHFGTKEQKTRQEGDWLPNPQTTCEYIATYGKPERKTKVEGK